MAAKAKKEYGNESISTLKGADRVRKRPGVIFGSDGLEGCEHSVFEILSNAIDEARQGYGKKIVTTRYADGSAEVQDFGRGCPVIITPRNSATIGSWFSASCMPAASTMAPATATTSTPSV